MGHGDVVRDHAPHSQRKRHLTRLVRREKWSRVLHDGGDQRGRQRLRPLQESSPRPLVAVHLERIGQNHVHHLRVTQRACHPLRH